MRWYLKGDALPKLSRAARIVPLAAERNLHPEEKDGEIVCHCPFCGKDELVLDPLTNRFSCRACRQWGNAFGLVSRLDRLPFMQALRRVAEHAGIDFESLLTD